MTGRFLSRLGRNLCAVAVLLALCGAVQFPAAAADVNSGADNFIPQKVLEGKLIPITGDFRSVDLDIRFRFGSAELTDSARRQLDALAGALASPELKDAKVAVNGHTDAVGSAANNRLLSEKRAQAVVQYLVRERGLAAGRFTAHGYGEERLLPDVAPDSGLQRRVQVVTSLSPPPPPPAEAPSQPGTVIIN